MFPVYRFPFDLQNPFGFAIAFSVIFVILFNLVFYMVIAFIFGIGIYLLVTTLTKDIKNDLNSFGDLVNTKPTPTVLAKQLFDAIEFHSIVKRCDGIMFTMSSTHRSMLCLMNERDFFHFSASFPIWQQLCSQCS